jgi:hypothetical protein
MAKNKENKTSNRVHMAAEEEFLSCHKALRGQIDNASWHFQTWKRLWKLVEDYHQEMNVAHTFFRLTMRAHLLQTVLRMANICERSEEHVNFPDFLDFVKKDLDIFQVQDLEITRHGEEDIEAEIIADSTPTITAETVEGHLRVIENLPLDKLMAWRDDALSHVDRHVAKDHIKLLEESPVDIDDLDRIIAELDHILNVYSVAYDGQTWDRNLVFEHGIQNMMDAIRVGRRDRKKKGAK